MNNNNNNNLIKERSSQPLHVNHIPQLWANIVVSRNILATLRFHSDLREMSQLLHL